MLSKIRKLVNSPAVFNQIVSGLFTSKLTYCMSVWGAIWNIPGENADNSTRTSFTKCDLRRLQVLQNKIMRLQTGLPFGTATSFLLEKLVISVSISL